MFVDAMRQMYFPRKAGTSSVHADSFPRMGYCRDLVKKVRPRRTRRRASLAAGCAHHGNPEIWRVNSAVTLVPVAMPNTGYTVLSPLAAKPM